MASSGHDPVCQHFQPRWKIRPICRSLKIIFRVSVRSKQLNLINKNVSKNIFVFFSHGSNFYYFFEILFFFIISFLSFFLIDAYLRARLPKAAKKKILTGWLAVNRWKFAHFDIYVVGSHPWPVNKRLCPIGRGRRRGREWERKCVYNSCRGATRGWQRCIVSIMNFPNKTKSNKTSQTQKKTIGIDN